MKGSRQAGAAKVIALRQRGAKGPRCPICGKAVHPEQRPFCSARCKQIDLGRWLKGVYSVPTDEAPSEAGDLDEGPPDEAPE